MKKVLRAMFGPPSPRLLQEIGLDPLDDRRQPTDRVEHDNGARDHEAPR
ncbi:MAG TPA: hypothetical protein PLB21_05805 [Actinomycetota bacterium]|nr:hypothetical protein [Actinomycetota bacterium]